MELDEKTESYEMVFAELWNFLRFITPHLKKTICQKQKLVVEFLPIEFMKFFCDLSAKSSL